MNQRALDSFRNVEDLIKEEKHQHKESTINLFDRHQIWLVSSSLAGNSAAAKTRSWYILNPEAGLGKVLAAPISKSYINGVPIDIGKNFMMYIRLDMCTSLSLPHRLFDILELLRRRLVGWWRNFSDFYTSGIVLHSKIWKL